MLSIQQFIIGIEKILISVVSAWLSKGICYANIEFLGFFVVFGANVQYTVYLAS